MIFTHNTVIRVIDLTHGAHAARITKIVRGECTAAFLTMVLFVAVARIRIFGAVGSAVAEPVVKSVAAAEFAFCAVLVARKGGQDRGRDHTDRHDHYHHEAQDPFQSCFDHFPFLLLLYSIFPALLQRRKIGLT